MPTLTAFSWDTYYRTAPLRGPSAFARWCEPRFPARATIVDLGCGDGRDASLFAARGHHVTAIDLSAEAIGRIDDPLIDARVADAAALEDDALGWDVGYLRWVLHAVTEGEQAAILAWCARNVDAVYVEARSGLGAHPTDHYRRPLDMTALMRQLGDLGFAVEATEEGYGLSVTADDDPLLLRVVASLSTKTAGVLAPADQRRRRGAAR